MEGNGSGGREAVYRKGNGFGGRQSSTSGSLFGRENKDVEDVEYAGFWARLAAYAIDLAIVWIGLLFVRLMIGVVSLAVGEVFRAQILFHYTLRDIILYVLQVLYFILLTYYTGTTPGKRLLNLRVINADGRERLEFINVVYRETVGRFLCGLSVGIGYIMAGVDREKRGLHDMLCDTRVIYGKKIKVFPKYQAPKYYPPIPPMPPAAPQGGMPQGGYGAVPPMPGTLNGMPPQDGMPQGGTGSVPPMPGAPNGMPQQREMPFRGGSPAGGGIPMPLDNMSPQGNSHVEGNASAVQPISGESKEMVLQDGKPDGKAAFDFVNRETHEEVTSSGSTASVESNERTGQEDMVVSRETSQDEILADD